jgi:predicted metal-dependent HD superfamily phosphohydrolase
MRIFETKREVLDETGPAMLTLWRGAYPNWQPSLGIKALETVLKAFEGDHPDYEANDAPYHDLEHTLRASFCYMQLVERISQHRDFASLTRDMAQLGWIAILFHDIGYLKDRDDHVGSGARHSFVHVERSQKFAAEWMSDQNMDPSSIQRVQSMILCTEFSPHRAEPSFDSEAHQLAGNLVGTADWLAQMAAPDYLDKLHLLHQEMLEAKQASPDMPTPIFIPETASELIQSTPKFFEQLVKPKLEHEFDGVFRLLNDPYPNGPNPYLDRIQEHLNEIQRAKQTLSKA